MRITLEILLSRLLLFDVSDDENRYAPSFFNALKYSLHDHMFNYLCLVIGDDAVLKNIVKIQKYTLIMLCTVTLLLMSRQL